MRALVWAGILYLDALVLMMIGLGRNSLSEHEGTVYLDTIVSFFLSIIAITTLFIFEIYICSIKTLGSARLY
jgi:hypothetical protein